MKLAAATTQSTARSTATTHPTIAFVYAHWFDEVLPPLPAGELRRILDLAERAKPAGRDVWFVVVREDWPEHRRDWFTAAEVYYTPDTSSPRLRMGRWARVWSADSGWPPLVESYAQVAPVGHPFGDVLEVPDAAGMPIKEIEGVGRGALVPLVDAVRAAPASPTDQPLFRVEPHGNEFTAYVGWTETAYSDVYTLTGVDGRFEVTGRAMVAR